jgi:hypothetical protein
MSLYLANLHELAGFSGLVLALALFVVLGAILIGRRDFIAVQLFAGWGAVSVVFTVWAVATPWPLQIPLAALSILALGALASARMRQRIAPLAGVWRMLVLTLPLWLIMLPARPSQVDTWLNLLPNAAYLFDHGVVPAAMRPPSYSFLPGAPYNTQFVAFIASVASGSFAEGAMALFNIALQCAAALLLAHVVAGTRPESAAAPPWWACAVGFLLAIPLNPGFIPRVFLAPYGEAPLAVATLFAAWLAVRMIDELASGRAWPPAAWALALELAVLVNIKQSGPGLVAPIGVATLALLFLHPRLPRLRGAMITVATLLPSAALFLLWHAYVQTHLVDGELELMPQSAWNLGALSQILSDMFFAAFEKITYFVAVAVVLVAAVWELRRDLSAKAGLVLGLCLGIIPLFNLFLIFTYVAHFGQEHSYFRYMSQLSLLIMLGLVVTFRPRAAVWIARRDQRARRRLADGAIVLVMVLPIAFLSILRIDLLTPAPVMWDMAKRVAAMVKPGDRLALLLPGDHYDSTGSMLRGVLLFTPPRRIPLDLRTETTADTKTLDAVGAAGYRLAFVSCTPAGLPNVPPKVAAMLALRPDGWKLLAAWSYPPDLAQHHFTSLPRGPACAE